VEAEKLRHPPLIQVPLSVAARFAATWTDSLEGCMAGDRDWGALARYRCRWLLGPISGSDRVEELKRRLRLWEDGRFQELLDRLRGQQSEAARMSRSGGAGVDAEERLGGSTRKKAREGAVSKAFKGLVGGVQNGTESERRSWTKELIPQAEAGHATLTTDTERQESAACSWGCGNDEEAKRAMRQAGRSAGSPPKLPWVRLPPLSAPGPSGERPEHLEDILNSTHTSAKRKLLRALDKLTVRWATGSLPDTCRWLLNTRVMFLRKDREPVDNDFDDVDWLTTLSEEDVTNAAPPDATDTTSGSVSKPKVRPIQMGEYIR